MMLSNPDRLMDTTPTQTNPLMTALHFTEADLTANRDGHLSERQRGYLRIDRQKNMILGGVLITGLVFAITAMLFVGIDSGNLILQGLGVLLLFCNIGLSWFFGLSWIRMTYDLRSNSVNIVEGDTQHVVRKMGRAQAGSVRVGDSVEVPAEDIDQFTAFEPGVTYRLYRTTHTHRLLSAERVS
jgi:hypothetical protein